MSRMLYKILLVLIISGRIMLLPEITTAQTVSVKTQKQVISGFKIDDPARLFPLSSVDCNLKVKGDADCDGKVSLIDLSLWQVEFNNRNSIKWSDFNGDKLVDLDDFQVWRDNYENEPSDKTISFVNKAEYLLKRLLNINAFAQEAGTSGDANLNSFPVISADGSSIIVNENEQGNRYITLDGDSNLVETQQVDTSGRTISKSLISGLGDEVSSFSQNGVNIQVVKKAEGAVFQFFSGSGDVPLAVKTWPNIESLQNGDPPLAVSIPMPDGREMAMNINSNGSSIITQLDTEGNTLLEAQVRNDGTFLSNDKKFQTKVESNSKLGSLTVRIPNELGGETTYYFYKSALFALVQTEKSGGYHIAKPADDSGKSWIVESEINGQKSEKTVANPVSDLKSGVPEPGELIQYINYYRSLPQNTDIINFSDNFGSIGGVPTDQVLIADQMLSIQGAPQMVLGVNKSGRKSSFGLVREAYAQSSTAGVAAAASTQVAVSGSVTGQGEIGLKNLSSQVTVSGDSQSAKIVNPAKNVSDADYVVLSQTNSAQKGSSNWSANGTTISATHSQVTAQAKPYKYYYTATSPGTPTGSTPIDMDTGRKGTCFLAGTRISTPNGLIRIEELTPSDPVYSFNDITGQKEISYFSKLDINFVDSYLTINGVINTSLYHPFYVYNFKSNTFELVKAENLAVGNMLMDEYNNLIPVQKIDRIEQKTTVYNLLSVTPNNNFYAEGILVHNYQDPPRENGQTSEMQHDPENTVESTLGEAAQSVEQSVESPPSNDTTADNVNTQVDSSFDGGSPSAPDSNTY